MQNTDSTNTKLCNCRYFPRFPRSVLIPIYKGKGREIISTCQDFNYLALPVWGCTALPELEEDAVCKCFNSSVLRNRAAALICCVTKSCLQNITPSPARDSFGAKWKALAKRDVFSPPTLAPSRAFLIFWGASSDALDAEPSCSLRAVDTLRRYRCAQRSHQTFGNPRLGKG